MQLTNQEFFTTLIFWEDYKTSMHSISNVLFDLDGTIIEPEEGIVNSVVYALKKLGIEETNRDELKSFIGPPLIDSFKYRYGLSDSQATEAVNYYREFFAEKGIYQNTLYDGIEDLLEYLTKNDFRLFIATSKPTVFAEKILKNFNLDKFFEGIVGSNLDNTRKDKAEVIQYLLNEFDLEKEATIMIGDRKFDTIGAKENSLKSIGVTYGHGSPEELQEVETDYLVDNCKELQSLFMQKRP